MMDNEHVQLPLKDCIVLIVEDEYFIAEDLRSALERAGAKVLGPVAELSEAIEMVNRDGFDVAIIDINLHGHSAYVLADELARQDVPFVFATGYSAEVIPERFRHVKRWEKPYELGEVLDDVAGLCRRRRTSGRHARLR